MGKAGVHCMSMVTVCVYLVTRTGATDRFRVRPRANHKFQARGSAEASARAWLSLSARPVLVLWHELGLGSGLGLCLGLKLRLGIMLCLGSGLILKLEMASG